MRIRMWIAASLALAMTAVGACDRQEDRRGAGPRTDDRQTSPAPTASSDQEFMNAACRSLTGS